MSQLFEIEKDYPYWENFKYKVKTLTDYDAKFLWKIIKMQRRQSFSGIEISKIVGFDFRYNTNSKILEHLHHFDLYLGGVMEGEIIPSEDKNRYLISSIMEEAIASSQLEGAYLFTEYDENDLTYFIDFNLRAMELALKNLQNYIKRKIDEKQRMYKFIKNENFNERQADLIGTLITDSQRVLTIKEVEIKYDIVYQTARLDLLGLEEMGYLKSKNIGKKLVFYVVDDFDSKIRKLSKI